MEELNLAATAREQSRRAAGTRNGRAATTVDGGHDRSPRQTVIALEALEDAAVLLTVVER